MAMRWQVALEWTKHFEMNLKHIFLLFFESHGMKIKNHGKRTLKTWCYIFLCWDNFVELQPLK